MTTIKIAKIGKNPTVNYAVDELIRCLHRIDARVLVDKRVYDSYDADKTNLLWVGTSDLVDYSKLDDEILIDVKNGCGIITGANVRAVLIAVYRFLYELGCRWIRPGDDGEVFPEKMLMLSDLCVNVREMPSTRYRTVCIEGAAGYEHIYDMVNWLPKVGLNCYYLQYKTPHPNLKVWEEKNRHPKAPVGALSTEDSEHIKAAVDEEIVKRGLIYMCMGHGFTIFPFGIEDFTLSDPDSPLLTPELRSKFALLGTERKFGKCISFTQLCYSDPEVRKTIVDFALDYLTENPHVELLAFALADGMNNWCECEECRKKRPSDWMIIILNEIDEKLTAAGIDTQLSFPTYLDTAWAPLSEKLKNPARFIMSVCPNGRSYRKALWENERDPHSVTPKDYIPNKIDVARDPEDVLALYYEWRSSEPELECMLTDYHLMWEHYFDLGYNYTARVLHKDCTGLYKNGFTGFKMFMEQRQAFPTALPMYSMAMGLWNKDSKFEDIAEDYYRTAFGDGGRAVYEYLDELERLFDSEFLRYEHPEAYATVEERCNAAKELVKDFRARVIEPHKEDNNSWRYLYLHAEYAIRYADLILAHDQPNVEFQEKACDEFVNWLWSIEDDIHRVFDHCVFLGRVMFRLKRLFSLKPEKEVNF